MNANKQIIKNLFHYTSIDVLCKLFTDIKNNQLLFHASSVDFMNDTAEYLLAKRQCKDEIDEMVIEHMKGIPFVLCFSENEDNIPMWTMYANEGKGVCFKFNFEKLKTYFENWSIREKRNAIFSRCQYEKINLSEDITKPFCCSENRTDIDALWKEISQKAFIKPVCFSHENEWRFIVWQNVFPLKNQKIKFKVRNDELCPYIEIPIPGNCIEEIILKPKADDQLINATRLLLANYGGNGINVKDANITLKI